MNDEIFFDEVKYICANDAAASSGLTRDYVARLCREGKLRGRQIGKNWYVNQESLSSFLVNQSYLKAARREEVARERLDEYYGLGRDKSASVSPRRTTPVSPSRELEVHRALSPVQKVFDVHTALAKAATKKVSTLPSGTFHAAASLGSHLSQQAGASLHVLSPVTNFFHKLIALTVALLLTFGTYTIVNPEAARVAADVLRGTKNSIEGAYAILRSGGIKGIAARAQAQFAAVAEDPGSAIDAASSLAARFARSLNSTIDSYLYAIAFPDSLVYGNLFGGRELGGSVIAKVVPHQQVPKISTPSTLQGIARSSAPTLRSGPVIERVIETERIVSLGGISEEVLNARIKSLRDELSDRIYSLTSANSTQVTQVYQTLGAVARIEHLDKLDLTDPTITGGSISNTSISATSLSVSGTGTSTFANGIDLADGCFAVDGTCMGGGTIDGTGTANLFAYWTDGDTLSATSSPTAGYFVATSSVASILPYASSTAITVSGTASSTNLIVSGLNSADCDVKSSTSGVLSCGTDTGGTFPFTATTFGATTANSTSTLIGFTQGIYSLASSTIGNGTAAGGLTVSGTATSTNLAITGVTSSLLKTNSLGQVTAATAGTDYQTFAFPWTPTTNFGVNTNATSTALSLLGGLNASSTVRFGNAGLSQFFFDGAVGNLGLGTSTPFASLQIATTTGKNLVLSDSGAGANLKHWLLSSLGGVFSIGTTTDAYATSTPSAFTITNAGNVGIGTTSPYARLTVQGETVSTYFTATSTTATSTFAGGLNVGSGALTYDYSGGLTTIQNLALGSITFDTDAGIVSWVDLPVTSSASAGTVESYTAQIDGSPILTVYAESDGTGNIRQQGVSIGTSTPTATLTVWNATTTGGAIANFVDVASSTVLYIGNNGRVGIGTTSPGQKLSVAGDILGNNIIGSYFTATTTTASSFPYASTTMITATTASSTALIVSGLNSASCDVKADTSGVLSCGTDANAGFPFTPTTSFGTAANSTSTLLLLTNGLSASSTVRFGNAGVNAQFQFDSSTGFLGLGSSTPWAQLSINPTSANGAAPAFAIGSSSATTFVVTNAGNVGIGTSSPFTYLSIEHSDSTKSPLTTVAFNISSTTSTVSRSMFSINADGSFTSGLVASAFSGNSIINGGALSIASDGNTRMVLNSNEILVGSAGRYGFGSASTVSVGDNPDASLFRLSAGTIGVSNSTGNSSTNADGRLVAGFIGIGSSTPFSLLSVVATSTSGLGSPLNLFMIASTTGGTATSTLFSVSNTGLTTFTTLTGGAATTTSLSVSGIASSTALIVSGLNAASCDVKADTSGVFSCGTDSAGAAFPFTPSTYAGQGVNATSTGLWLMGSPLSLIASSTFATFATTTNATSTAFFATTASSTNLYSQSAALGALTLTTDLAVAQGGTGLSTFGGVNTLLYTTAADTLASEAALTYDPATNKLTVDFASTTNLSVSGTASSTNLVVSGLNAADCDVKSSTSGVLSCGTDTGGTFPFTATTFGATTANSTSTLIGFTAGLYSLASSTIGNGTAGGGLTVSGTATTTNAVITGVTSSLLKTNALGQVTAAVAGTDYQTFAFPWTTTTSFGTAANSTSTLLLLTNGLSASSTVRFGNAGLSQFFFDGAVGNLGLGTTSPYSKLSVWASGSNTGARVFEITDSASTTLFSVSDSGTTTIGNSSGTGDANFQFAADQNAWSMGYYATDKSFRIASSTSLSSSVALTITKSSSLSIGIGTTSPWAQFSINPTSANGSAPSFAIGSSTGTTLVVTNAGSVGIGTSTPFAFLSIHAASTTQLASNKLFAIASTSASGAISTLFSISNTGSTTLFQIPSSLLKTDSSGTIVAAVAVTDYAAGNVAFPFTPTTFGATAANSTSTLIGFTQGIYALASSTIGNGTAGGGLTVSGTATTTNAVITGVTSSLLKSNALGQVTAAVLGTDYQTFAFPFTPTTNFGAAANSTSTPVWFQQGLQASSTIFAQNVDIDQFSSYKQTGNTILYASSTNSSTLVGISAGANLLASTSAAGNTALGYQALLNATSSSYNTAVGYQALLGSATISNAGFNSALGYKALTLNSIGKNNIGIGYMALSANTVTSDNIGIGTNALKSNAGGAEIFPNTSPTETVWPMRTRQLVITPSLCGCTCEISEEIISPGHELFSSAFPVAA